MTEAQRKKSVAIAKDVLKNMKLMRVETKTYFAVPLDINLQIGVELKDQLGKLLTPAKPCRVCALGACLISHVNLYDDFKVPERTERSYPYDPYARLYDDDFEDELIDSMGARNMVLIEDAFELTCQSWYGRGNFDVEGYDVDHVEEEDEAITDPTAKQQLRLDAIAFGQRYADPEKRLAAIMRNVIRNDGEFTP